MDDDDLTKKIEEQMKKGKEARRKRERDAFDEATSEPTCAYDKRFPRCKGCGGWGSDLVGSKGMCSYCWVEKGGKLGAFEAAPSSAEDQDAGGVAAAAAAAASKDSAKVLQEREDLMTDEYKAEIAPFLREGYVDITPLRDGGVLKKILKTGEGEYPQEGCPCFIQFVGRLLDGNIFDTSRDVIDGKHVGGTDDPEEFQIFRDKGITGWDHAIQSMGKGELAMFVMRSDYAYGAAGKPPKVFPGATVQFEIELLRWKDSLPRFPSQEELARSKRERQEEERRQYEANPPPSIDERVAEAEKEKEAANALFREGKYEEAKKKYDAGFVNVYIGKDEWNHLLSDEDKKKINDIKGVLHLNRAMCKLRIGTHEDALWDCDRSLDFKPGNAKGHYRRAKVYLAKVKDELAKEGKNEFWDVGKTWELFEKARADQAKADALAPNDPKVAAAGRVLKKELAHLERYTKRYKSQQKELYRDKILGKIEGRNKRLRAREMRAESAAQAAANDDMPELEDDEDEDEDEE